MPQKILYRSANETAPFDFERFKDNLKSYDSEVSTKDIRALLKEFEAYDPLHVSCLVEVGIKAMPNQEKAERYYNDHSEWFTTPNFERLRRITGYLVGTLDRWNDGKRAEEKDRVKHNVSYDHAAGQYSQDEKDEIERAKLENSLMSQI